MAEANAPADVATETKAADTATDITAQNPAPEVKATEAPAADTKAPEAEPKAGDKAADTKPEPVEYKFNVPEGVVADPEITAEFTTLAKELGLPADKAQQVYDLGLKLSQKTAANYQETITKTQAEWRSLSEADKEFGGDRLKESQAIAKRAVEVYPEISEFLAESKLGDHPEVFRWMYRVGRVLGEDRTISGTVKPGGSALDKLYPTMAQKH
jgi:hypothetical protein